MKQPLLYPIIATLASLLFIGNEALAQGDAPRFEIGGQFSLLSLNKPSSQGDEFVSGHVADPGFGARFTYNVTNNIALEAEGFRPLHKMFPKRTNCDGRRRWGEDIATFNFSRKRESNSPLQKLKQTMHLDCGN